jgi:CRP-like cAMP-binding protein
LYFQRDFRLAGTSAAWAVTASYGVVDATMQEADAMAKRGFPTIDSANRPPPRASLLPASNRPPPLLPFPPRASNKNLLLAALSDRDYIRIAPTLDVVSLKLKTYLHKPGEMAEDVFFPGDGFCSVLAVLQDGTMVEVATIGREGVSGLLNERDLGGAYSATMVQGTITTCYRMTSAAFHLEMKRRETFYDAVSGYERVLTRLVMQSAACNAVHSVEQRLARWLLTAHDHMASDTFRLTQEFVAMMLGVARPTVAVVAERLQRAGLITYRSGRLTIVDREQLEAAACECYGTIASLLVRGGSSDAQGTGEAHEAPRLQKAES